jgi:transposase
MNFLENTEVEIFIQKLFEENKILKLDNTKLQTEIEQLKARIEQLSRQLYGKKSEKNLKDLPTTQSKLPLFDEVEQDEIEVEENFEQITYRRRKPSKIPPREVNLKDLPRVYEVHDLAEDEKTCQECKEPLSCFGEDQSEKIEVIPSKIVVVTHVTKKYVCRCCETVKMGQREASAIPKALGGNSLLAKILVDKYQSHLPIYRQCKIYEGQGFRIPDITLGRWVIQLGEILFSLGAALWEEILGSSYVQIDESPVQCLDQKSKAYMWVYANFDQLKPKLVAFDFQTTRGQASVNEKMKDFKGKMQTDAYGGYSQLRSKDEIEGIGCGAHIRRKFVEAAHLLKNPKGKAVEALGYFEKLYAVETESREKGLCSEKRYELRQEKSKPILNDFHEWLIETQKNCVPKSPLGKAISYALNEWPYWSSYVKFGEVEIDNNWIENQIRPFALGRKNWLFVGNQEGGQASALFYSLIQSCRLNQIEAWSYLYYVLSHTHALRKKEVLAKDLLPHRVDPNAIKQKVLEYMQKITQQPPKPQNSI